MTNRTAFQHNPKAYEFDYLPPEVRHKLERLLSSDPHGADRPIAFQQLVSFIRDDRNSWLAMIAHFELIYFRDGEVHYHSIPDSDPEHQDEACRIAVRLDEMSQLSTAVHRVAIAERMTYDMFMQDAVDVDIVLMPHSAHISWVMSAPRAHKIIDNQPGRSKSQATANNPASALGTLIIPEIKTSHERIAMHNTFQDSKARLQHIFAERMSAANYHIGEIMPVS